MSPKEHLKKLLNNNLKSKTISEHYFAVWHTLNRVEELEKVLEIIKEKKVFIALLLNCKTVYEYNSHVRWLNADLTEIEFNILKENLK